MILRHAGFYQFRKEALTVVRFTVARKYLTIAYDIAFGEPFEHIILMKNGVQISPDRIIEIKPLTYWH